MGASSRYFRFQAFSTQNCPQEISALPGVSNRLEIKIVVPRGPQQRPGVPQTSSKFDLPGESYKFRGNALLWRSFRVITRLEQMHIHATVGAGSHLERIKAKTIWAVDHCVCIRSR
jgi:hypothetical protein